MRDVSVTVPERRGKRNPPIREKRVRRGDIRLSMRRMVDIFTPEQRSHIMSQIRGRDTKPELALRSILHRMGYRFTVNGHENRPEFKMAEDAPRMVEGEDPEHESFKKT